MKLQYQNSCMAMIRSLPGFLLGACVAGLFGVAHADGSYDLPSIGQTADATLAPDEEDKIGRDIVRQLRDLNYLLEDDEIETYLGDLGRQIATHTGRNPDQFTFFVVRDQEINAFALPGGYIGVNAGLILATRGEDELAGVVAHEIAHVTQRHIARQLQANGTYQIATAAALLLAILAGASDPDVVQAAMSVGIAATGQQQINFTRAHESEADRVGIHTMAAAGFNPQGMASFFQYMEERSRLYGDQLPEILQSHPVSNTRIAEALSRIGDSDPPAVRDQTEYELMQARLHVLTAKQVSNALDFYQPAQSASGKVREYGLSLAYYRGGQYPRAVELQQKLVKQNPQQVHFALALARTQLAAGRQNEALSELSRIKRDFPDYPPLILARSEMLIQAGQPEAARREILGSNLLNSTEPEPHRLLANAARDLNQLPEAHFQMAEYHRRRGNYLAALNQVDAGLALPGLDKVQSARLNSMKKALEAEAPPDARRRKRL